MRLMIGLILMISSMQMCAQTNCDTQFIQHLVNKESYREALFLLDGCSSPTDSLRYFRAWSHYSLKELELSIPVLLSISEKSSFYEKARFFAGYSSCYLGNYSKSKAIFETLNSNTKRIQELKEFQEFGINLLTHDFDVAEQKMNRLNTSSPLLYQPLIDLKNITSDLKSHKVKSPALAGIMSAIVPGSGKIYAGKTGQGLATFIATVGLGLITWENYHQSGITNFKTIAFGSLFAANYVSNIYGSTITAKVVENDYQTVMQNQILFNLHIPLRNFFE